MQIKKTTFFPFLPFLILISFVSFLNILTRIIFSPLAPYICKEMHLCHGDMGNLFFILSVGFALTLFGSQFVSSRFSYKTTVIFSIFMTGVSLVLASYSDTFDFFRLSLFLVGLSSGLFIPSAVAMIREVVEEVHLGKAFGVFATAQSFAFILGPLIVQHFISLYSWKQILNGFGLVATVISLVLFFVLKQGDQKGQPITVSFVRDIFSWPSFWILAALLCLINGLNVGIYNMTPDYFQNHSFLGGKVVNHSIVVARFIGIGTAIGAGVLADRFGLKRSLVVALIACGVLTSLMGITSPTSSLLLFCAQSPMAACLMPLIHFAMATIVPPEKNAAIISIMAPFGFMMGAGVVPQVLGFLGDFNLYAQGFVFFGSMAILSGAMFNLNRVYKHVEMSQGKRLES